MTEQRNEVILRLGAMGDILLTVPLLRAMALYGATPHILIHERWSELQEFLPAKVHLYKGSGSLFETVSELRKIEPQALFDLQGKVSTVAIRTLVNAPITRVWEKRTLSEQYRAAFKRYPLRLSDQRPVWQKYAIACGVTINKPDPCINISQQRIEQAQLLLKVYDLQEGKYILVHPQASYKSKFIPSDLLVSLTKKSPLPIALIGKDVKQAFRLSNYVDLTNFLNLSQLPALMKLSAGVISSDSGPMHLARSSDAKVAAVFCQTCPSLGFAPVPSPKVLTISKELSCKPCSLHGQRDSCPDLTDSCKRFDCNKIAEKIFDFFLQPL